MRCDQPIIDSVQDLVCARQYASRWLIEDFHKAQKTGLGPEKLQLQTAACLFLAVALRIVVALALVDMHEKSRLEPDLPVEAIGMMDNELRVLRHQGRHPLDAVRAVYLGLTQELDMLKKAIASKRFRRVISHLQTL